MHTSRLAGVMAIGEAVYTAAEALDRIARKKLKPVPIRRGATLRPGVDTPLWRALATAILPLLRRRGAKARLMLDPGIIRNRLKVEASVLNARAFLATQAEFDTFDRYLWSFVGGRPIQHNLTSRAKIPVSTPESDALSKDLKKRGFKFVGTTICYAFMQATGMVNDHLVTCPQHKVCAKLGQ